MGWIWRFPLGCHGHGDQRDAGLLTPATGCDDDEEYAFLQFALVANPQIGVVIPGTGGIRKLRWAGSGRGKRGGARVIYFVALQDEQILMLYVYAKNDRGNLSEAQKKALRMVVEAEYGSRTPI